MDKENCKWEQVGTRHISKKYDRLYKKEDKLREALHEAAHELLRVLALEELEEQSEANFWFRAIPETLATLAEGHGLIVLRRMKREPNDAKE